ncbi:MAG TPA: HAMP domain-containing sensor histidine kinase [Acidimicrobiia bacterium]
MTTGFMRHLRSVRARITIFATAVFAVAFVLAAWGLVRTVDHRVRSSARSTATGEVNDLEHQIFEGTPLNSLTPESHAVYFQLIDAGSGHQVVGTNAPTGTTMLAFDSRGTPHAQQLAGVKGETIYSQPTLVRYPVIDQETGFRQFHNGWLIVAASFEGADKSVTTLRHSLWIATPLLILLVALMTWLFVSGALQPVEAIREEVEEIKASTMNRRVPVPDTDDEIQRLAVTMNEMLDRLETSSLRQREFVSDASHELRSPIASMRAELEVALAHPEAADWPLVAERVLGERDRLERLVDDLLQLARLEESHSVHHEDVDLDDLVLTEAAHTRRVPITTSGVSAGRVMGDRRSLEQVVRNLLDNAARHASTSVETSVASVNSHVVLRVDDDGPGVPVDERQRIFERFARSDDGRGREHGGAGIGLALVQRVVVTHGGTVACTDAPSGGARFEVTLPSS